MGLAMGVLFLWIGSACLWVASHATEATTPWGVFKEITGGLKAA